MLFSFIKVIEQRRENRKSRRRERTESRKQFYKDQQKIRHRKKKIFFKIPN